VTREEVWKRVSAVLREDCGRLVDVRDVRRVRRVAGESWTATVVLAAPSGDVHVADVTVEDSGDISPRIGAEHVIEAVKRAENASRGVKPLDDLGDFGADLGAASDSEPALDMLADEEPIEKRVAAALGRGDAASLREAQQLLPRLLTDPTSRPPRASSPTASTSTRWRRQQRSRCSSSERTTSPARPSTRCSSRVGRASNRSTACSTRAASRVSAPSSVQSSRSTSRCARSLRARTWSSKARLPRTCSS
jgi:hypothetical protein